MKKFIAMALCAMVFVLSSCDGTKGPTGDPEKDGKQFAEIWFKSLKENNAKLLDSGFEEYYNYYKKEFIVDQYLFLNAVDDAISECIYDNHDYFERTGYDRVHELGEQSKSQEKAEKWERYVKNKMGY